MSGPSVEGLRFPAAPPPVSADVGIVAALPMEVGFLTDRLAKVRKYSGPTFTVTEGEFHGKLIVVVVGGMGRSLARSAAQHLLDGHRPRWLLCPGFGGALNLNLRRNDVVVAKEILDTEGHSFSVDFSIADDPERTGPKILPGRLLTVDAIVEKAAEKAELHARHQADVLDMETSAVASLCEERRVRFLSIRVISDEAGRDLPPEIATLLTRSGSYRVGAALRAIWNRPSSLKDFWALHEHAQEAADRLAEVTLWLISHLPD